MIRGKNLTCVAVVMMLMTGTVACAEGDLSVGVGADFLNKYIWRGQNLVDDWVFQPAVSVGCAGFTGSVWGNFDLTDENTNAGEFTELDFTLDYSNTVPGVDELGFSLGLIYYDFPNSGGVSGTLELYWGLSLDVPLAPTLTVYHDVDEAEGTYANFGIGHTLEEIFTLGPDMPVALEIGATIGWGDSGYNSFYWGPSSGEFNDLVVSLALPFAVAGISVTPSVSYITVVNGDLRAPAAYGPDEDFVIAGIGFAKEF